MSVVRFLPTVAIRPTPAAARIIGALDYAASFLGLDLTVTSGAEELIPPRAASDPHMTGEAFDVRVNDLAPKDIRRVYEALRSVLEAGDFTVLFEGPKPHPELADIQYVNPKATGFHFHIQRKKGTVFP